MNGRGKDIKTELIFTFLSFQLGKYKGDKAFNPSNIIQLSFIYMFVKVFQTQLNIKILQRTNQKGSKSALVLVATYRHQRR